MPVKRNSEPMPDTARWLADLRALAARCEGSQPTHAGFLRRWCDWLESQKPLAWKLH